MEKQLDASTDSQMLLRMVSKPRRFWKISRTKHADLVALHDLPKQIK